MFTGKWNKDEEQILQNSYKDKSVKDLSLSLGIKQSVFVNGYIKMQQYT